MKDLAARSSLRSTAQKAPPTRRFQQIDVSQPDRQEEDQTYLSIWSEPSRLLEWRNLEWSCDTNLVSPTFVGYAAAGEPLDHLPLQCSSQCLAEPKDVGNECDRVLNISGTVELPQLAHLRHAEDVTWR